MKRREFLWKVATVSSVATVASGAQESNEIRLILRGDDMASSHAANEACLKCAREGIARSIEIMVPCPWFPEAVAMLKDNAGIDVGVHLTLTSEWDRMKWRPLTGAPGLMDAGGFFPANNNAFLQLKPKPDEVEKELRAQIETAKARIASLSHLSAHMGTPTITPEVRAVTERLAREYGLPLEAPAARPLGHWSREAVTPEAREAAFIGLLESATPGLYLFIEHPGLDTPEMRALGHKGYENVAADRAGVTHVMTSAKVKEAIARKGIRLMSYGELYTTR
jgi:hypothetical protein